jgi:hypothetical protein
MEPISLTVVRGTHLRITEHLANGIHDLHLGGRARGAIVVRVEGARQAAAG